MSTYHGVPSALSRWTIQPNKIFSIKIKFFNNQLVTIKIFNILRLVFYAFLSAVFANTSGKLRSVNECSLPDIIEEVEFDKIEQLMRQPKLSKTQLEQIEHEKIKYVVQNSMGVKFIDWKYENEYRLIMNYSSRTNGIMSLPGYAPFLKVTGIILGDKMSEDDRKHIEMLWNSHEKKDKIKLFQSKCDDEEYKIFCVPRESHLICVNSR